MWSSQRSARASSFHSREVEASRRPAPGALLLEAGFEATAKYLYESRETRSASTEVACRVDGYPGSHVVLLKAAHTRTGTSVSVFAAHEYLDRFLELEARRETEHILRDGAAEDGHLAIYRR